MTYGFTSSVTKLTYKHNLLINDNTVWYCLICSKKLYPFSALNDNDFHSIIQGKTIKFKAFTRKRSSIENVITDKLNDAVSESDLENSSQYFEVDDFNKAFNSSNHKGTNFFHIKINISFDVIGITET